LDRDVASTKPIDKEHTAIRVATLRGDARIPFDVYVKVAGKYILYCRRGDSFEGVRLDRLRAKKLRKMFVKTEDEIPYQQYLEENINNAYDNRQGKPLRIRTEIIQGFQQAKIESFVEDALDEFSYEHLRSSTQRFTEFIEHEPEALKELLEIPNVDLSISHHSVNVAAIAVGLTLETGMREGAPLQLLALGCLLHDIEHLLAPREDLSRPLKNLSPKELALYKEHPLRGAHRLQGGKFLDQLVLNIIKQHEEVMDGSGFPKGLYLKDVDPLVPVAGLANAFERMLSFEALPPRDAIKKLFIDKMGQYSLDQMQALQKLLKSVGLLN